MNRINKAAAWAVLLILFVLSGVIVHAQDETMSTNTPESILEEASKEAVIEEGGKSVEVLFDASKDLVNEAVQAGAANEGDKNAEENGEQEGTPAKENPQGQTGDQTAEPEANAEGEAEIKPVDPADVPAEGEQADSEVKTAEGNATPTEKAVDPKTEEDKKALEDSGDKKPEAVGEGNSEGGATGEPKSGDPQPAQPEDNGPKEVDPSKDEELKALQKQIDAAKKANDKKKEAELQKEYNEKLLKKIEETGSDKYADDTAKRLKEKDQIALYNQIREKKKELEDKLADKDAKPEDIQKDIDELNMLLGKFTPPRALTPDELDAINKLQETPYVPGVNNAEGTEGKKLFDAYEKAKKALKDATDPSITKEPLAKERLEELVNAFKEAENKLRQGMRDGTVNPKYAGEKPEISIFPLDNNGKAGEILDKDTYYIPDDTGLNLLFQVNKNDQPKEFTFTIKKLGKVGNTDIPEPKVDLNSLVFLNGDPVELKDNGDGTYSFTTSGEKTFGIAQLKFNMPGFRAAFHEGFELALEGTGDTESVTKKFLITKKGYEDYTNLNGKGLQKPGKEKPGKDDKIPEIDAGKTEDNIVDPNTDKVHDFFTELKKNNAYINEVLVNSANGKSLPLSSVDITITAPKNFNENFAELIHKSGLKYYDNGNGTYTLKLNLEKFNKDGKFSVGENNQLMYDGKAIENKKITEAILESTEGENKGKKYVTQEDGKEKIYDVDTNTVLEGKIDNVEYQVRLDKDHKVQSLWKKDGDSYTKVGDFKDGKVTDKGTTYELRGNDLISYTGEHDVFEGNVSNKKKDGTTDEYEAAPEVTPTYEGRQVQVESTETDSTGNKVKKLSYGGTIVKDKIFQKVGDKDLKYFIDQTGLKGEPEAWIDDNGKKVDSPTEDQKATLRKVENKVFDAKGYVVDGLEYKPGLTLIDKFGRPMNNISVKKDGDNYTFIHAIKKDEKGNALKIEAKKEGSSNVCKVTYGGRTITVGDKDKEQIFVNNQNYLVNSDDYNSIIGNYYYDKDNNKFVPVGKDKVIGDKYYEDLKKTEKLERKTIETYDNGTKIITNPKIQRYYGSLDPKDYYTIVEGTETRTYIKKGSGKQTYLESADGKEAKIIAGFKGQYIVQTLGDKQVITNEADIFDAVQKAKFAFRYPGFLAGKDIVYSAKAEVKAKYMDPESEKEVSIFGNDESKTVTRYFTLKTNDITNPRFFKNKPVEFEKYGIPNYNFFNIFYRDSNDRKRDQLIKDLFEKDKAVKDAEKAMNEAKADKNKSDEDKEKAKKAYEKLAKDNKFYTDLLKTLQDELGKRFNGAKFAVNDKDEVEIQDKDGKAIELDRSLLWEIGFESKKGDLLFPEDRDTSIVVEDHNMDNRLVYDEIIINDTEEKWNEAKNNADKAYKKAKEAYDAAKKKYEENKTPEGEEALKKVKEALDKAAFKGTDQYFFLNQIDNIRFGVSRGYVDGDFIAVGKDFKITREQIEGAFTGDNKEGEIELGLEGKKFKVKLTRDTDKGQIRIKVLNAFYQKNGNYDSEDKNSNKFYSPTQEAYEIQRQKFIKDANSAEKDKGFKVEQKAADEANKKSAAQATKDAFQESFENFIKETYGEDTDCFGTLTHLFEEKIRKVKVKDGDKDRDIADVVKDLTDIRNSMVETMKTMGLKYLDSSKGEYKFDDMRFNAIRVELKPNMVIGGAMTPQRTKKFGITSVIVPDVDIPYTDEFGKPMTNKDMYLNKFINDILSDKKFGEEQKEDQSFKAEGWDKKEESYVKVMEEAYRRLNAEIKNNPNMIVDLVTVEKGKEKEFAWEKYTVKKGKDLGKDDLAIDGKPLTNPSGGRVNPWYIQTESKDENGKAKKELKAIEELVKDENVKAALKAKYGDKAIDLIAYYMIKDGYNRPTFQNFAQYKLPKQKQGPGIYGEENNWKEKLCYSGIIGKCIERSGGDEVPPTPGKNAKGDDGFKSQADITINYPETNDKPDEEHPEIDKKHKKSGTENDTGVIDIAETDQEVDFTIDVKVNQMTKAEKQLYDAENGKESQIKDGDYSENGRYRYKDGTLIMDILPNIFRLSNDKKVELEVNAKALVEGGSFENEKAVDEWKKGIKYQYVEDLKTYIDGIKDPTQKELLQKAYDKAVKDGEKVQAVIAWLPAFDAPSGKANHFTFKLNNVLVDKKEFKDYLGNGKGEIYTNHAIFKDNGEIYYASTDVPIKKGTEGSVDKYLRLRGKDGKIINGETAKEWFKGNAKLKFGDKFDYKLIYKAKTDIQDTSRVGEKLIKVELEDLFKGRKGFKPVLNGYVQVQDKYKDKFIIKYQIGDNENDKYTQEELEAKGLKLSDVTGIFVESRDAGVNDGEAPEFILPMMIPNIDAEIDEKGNLSYVGKDGEKKVIGKAKDFFDLDKLTKSGKENEMAFDNKIDKSNTVTVYLEKERFIKVFKEFLDANGKKLKDLNNLEAKFDIIQIIEENGVKKHVKVGELKANKDNNFTDMLDHLPIFKKTTTIEKDGTVKVKEVKYEYVLKEHAMPGFESKVWKMNDEDGLGFVWKATNTEEPTTPPGEPGEEPKEVTVTIKVNKVWKVLNGGSTPSIQVELYANGKATGKIITLGADGNWSASFKDLPTKDADGNKIIYTVREVGEAENITKIGDRKFEVSYGGDIENGFTITNEEIPEEPEEPEEEEPGKPDEPETPETPEDEGGGRNTIPKTGVRSDLNSIFFSGILLLALFFFKRKYFKN